MNIPNFRKTTDSDVETTIGSVDAGDGIRILINVKLHPTDIDTLHDVLHEFLKTKCQKTNDFLTEFEKEWREYHVDVHQSIKNYKPSV